MNGSLLMLAVVAVGIVLLVLAATLSALHSASRPHGGANRPRGGVRHHAYNGDGGGSGWSGWSGGDGGSSCGGGDGGGGGGGC